MGLGLGWFALSRTGFYTAFIPKNQHLSLLAHSLSTFSLEMLFSREESCYFGIFSLVFWFCCSELPWEGLEVVVVPLFLRESFQWLIPALCGRSQMSYMENSPKKSLPSG